MTKIQGAGTLLGIFLLLVPLVAGHGAPEPRELDTRVLLDDDGMVPFGGCLEACLAEGGLDLLALDVREAHFVDGTPAIVFRLITQTEAPGAGTITLSVTAGGKQQTFAAATQDGQAFTATGFTRLDGPFPVGDGHPQALDGWISASDLGVAPGDAITAISVQSEGADGPSDIMPGSWYFQGQPLPTPEEPALGEYTVKGPAQLVTITADPVAIQAPAQVTIRLQNPVAVAHFADLSVEGTDARLGNDAVNLDANGARDVVLTLGPAAAGTVRVTVVSDLGAYGVIEIPVTAPEPAPAANETSHNDHDHEHDDKQTPLPLSVLVAALALALILTRRK